MIHPMSQDPMFYYARTSYNSVILIPKSQITRILEFDSGEVRVFTLDEPAGIDLYKFEVSRD